MSATTAIIMPIPGTGIGMIGTMGLIVRMLATKVTARIADLRTDMNPPLNDTTKRIDAIRRDVAHLRDRTGTLRGTLSTFTHAGESPNLP